MPIEAFVRLADEPSVEPSLGDPRLVRGDQQDGLALGVEGEAIRQTPPSAVKRSSFMLACRDPLRVSARGRPSVGPNASRSFACASNSSCTSGARRRTPDRSPMEDDYPSHAVNMTPGAYGVKGMPTVGVLPARRAAVPRTQPPTCTFLGPSLRSSASTAAPPPGLQFLRRRPPAARSFPRARGPSRVGPVLAPRSSASTGCRTPRRSRNPGASAARPARRGSA